SAAGLAVDPAVAKRLLERLVVGEACRLLRALLGEHEPDPDWVGVVLCQPRPPRRGVAHDQLRQFDGHDREPASLWVCALALPVRLRIVTGRTPRLALTNRACYADN